MNSFKYRKPSEKNSFLLNYYKDANKFYTNIKLKTINF